MEQSSIPIFKQVRLCTSRLAVVANADRGIGRTHEADSGRHLLLEGGHGGGPDKRLLPLCC